MQHQPQPEFDRGRGVQRVEVGHVLFHALLHAAPQRLLPELGDCRLCLLQVLARGARGGDVSALQQVRVDSEQLCNVLRRLRFRHVNARLRNRRDALDEAVGRRVERRVDQMVERRVERMNR